MTRTNAGLVLLGMCLGVSVTDALTLVRRNRQLVKQHDELVDRVNNNIDQMKYMIHLLNVHKIALDDFDLIALQDTVTVKHADEI
jgi:hypothetical protein